MPQRTLDYLARGAAEGQRNAELFEAACQFRDAGIVAEEAETQLLARATLDGLSETEARTAIVLITPRIGTKQHIDLHDPFTDSQIVEISTVYMNDAIRTAPSRHWIVSLPKWMPPQPPTFLERLEGTAVESQQDEIRLATVYLVSPPDAAEDAEPDVSWTPYVAYAVFWNLNYISRAQEPTLPSRPLTLHTGLLNGMDAQ